MAFVLFRKGRNLISIVRSSLFGPGVCGLCSRTPTFLDKKGITCPDKVSTEVHLSPLFESAKPCSDAFNLEVVDSDTWQVTSGLAQVWRGVDVKSSSREAVNDEPIHYSASRNNELNFDEIEDMRIRGSLFYKLEKASKEFEEYNFEFRGKRSSKNKADRKEEAAKKERPDQDSAPPKEKLPEIVKKQCVPLPLKADTPFGDERKRLRTPTFNELTTPYHEPFCLDIYISKSSVRACIIHRVSSKVVVVAHSISKDFKFDLTSTKDLKACAAVGGVLAQRALADDIHNAIYSPRKGEKIEGKLQVVLQSIIDNGINVKVKIKQRKHRKPGHPHLPRPKV